MPPQPVRSVPRPALEADERAYIGDFGSIDFDHIKLIARSAKRAGLHAEIDPGTNANTVAVYLARRPTTKERSR